MKHHADNVSWKFHWLTNWDEIWEKGFVDKWKEWLDCSPTAHVFFHPALVRAWVETYQPIRALTPYFMLASSGAHSIFLPLVLWKRNWKNGFQRLLIPAGYSEFDYHDPILTGPADSFDWLSFWGAFERQIVRRPPVRFDRAQLDGIRRIFSGRGTSWNEADMCPFADVSIFKGSEEYLSSLKASLRGDLRRQSRRMAEVGQTEFVVFSHDQREMALNEIGPFLTAHTKRWPHAYKTPRLHANIVESALPAGLLHFSALKIGGKTAAWHLGFVYQDRFYYYLPAQEEAHEKLSPGKVLLLKCVEDAIARGLKIFDHLRGEENYKAGWTDKKELLCTYRSNSQWPFSRMRNMAIDRLRPRLLAGWRRARNE
jgi:CelD/BcsL family acetyltransferase involved in cellulose biosynthesis